MDGIKENHGDTEAQRRYFARWRAKISVSLCLCGEFLFILLGAPIFAEPDVNRNDWAVAHLRFEQAYQAHPPSAEKIAEVNQAYDRAIGFMLGGKLVDAVKNINELTASLIPGASASPAYAMATSLKITEQPAIWTYVAFSVALSPRVISMVPAPVSNPTTFEYKLVARAANGSLAMDKEFNVKVASGTEINELITIFANDVSPGMFDVEIECPDGFRVTLGRWLIVPRPLNDVRSENEKHLAEIKPQSPIMEQALAVCRARNELLPSAPPNAGTPPAKFDFNELTAELDEEIKALAEGNDPYAHRLGDYWRVLKVGDQTIPFRLYSPQPAKDSEPLPLVIALHGAGANENYFMDHCGAGLLKKLADEKKFIAVSPATKQFSDDPANLDRLIEILGQEYPIDAKRVYLIGHSMGAGTASNLARQRADKIRAVCCVGGGAFNSAEGKLPPTLAITGELDTIVPTLKLQEAAQKAKDAGLPVELRVVKYYGHSLILAATLPDAVDWLLKR